MASGGCESGGHGTAVQVFKERSKAGSSARSVLGIGGYGKNDTTTWEIGLF